MGFRVERSEFDVEHGFLYYLCFKPNLALGEEFISARITIQAVAWLSETSDLAELTFVDSMGLGTLVQLYVSAKSGGSCLELINLGKQVRELLGITHLLGLFGDMCEKGVAVKF